MSEKDSGPAARTRSRAASDVSDGSLTSESTASVLKSTSKKPPNTTEITKKKQKLLSDYGYSEDRATLSDTECLTKLKRRSSSGKVYKSKFSFTAEMGSQ